jgi:glycine/D-amino acid oxidase-like deaminating enzyme
MSERDVLIVGGGVVGSATAYYLRKHGFGGRIAIVEKDTTYQLCCTARSVGGLRQQFSTPENIALSRFGLALIRNLKTEFGPEADVNFREFGYLMMASEEGLAVLWDNHRIQIANGADNILLKGPDLAARFPWINPDGLAAACYGLSGEGWLDPYSLMTLLRKAAVARGVEVIPAEVVGIETREDRVTGVRLSNGEHIETQRLVNAAGSGAGALARLAGIELPVGPRKRYVYVIDCPNAPEAMYKAPLSVCPEGVFVRPEGRHFLTGTSPEEHEEPKVMDWEVDYGYFEERIWPVIANRYPVFETVKVINAWVGHYDYNALDQNGIIGKHPRIENFYFGNGFSGHGLQQGPATGNAIAELIVYGSFRTIDLTRLGYERIARGEPLYERNII